MKAPDKLYIGDNQVQPNGFCGLAWTNPKDILEPMEYIRKEALLEWLKDKYELLEEDVHASDSISIGASRMIECTVHVLETLDFNEEFIL